MKLSDDMALLRGLAKHVTNIACTTYTAYTSDWFACPLLNNQAAQENLLYLW